MEIGIFEVLGPVMIGPSSSHTAGALKLARTAALIAGRPFDRVRFGLYGSFSKTATGHGTDRALLAGALGFRETDDGIKNIFDTARAQGIEWDYYEVDLAGVHENTCVIIFFHADGTQTKVTGSSVGGGRIVITNIDGVATEFTAQSPTLLLRHRDRKGVLGAVATRIAESDINIGIMRLSRDGRGNIATTVIETDSAVPDTLLDDLRRLEHVLSVRFIHFSN